MNDKKLRLSSDVIVMDREPMPELSPEDVRAWLALHQDENGLAKAFATVSNEFWWVEDNEYDYEKGTPEYEEAVRITDAWGALMDELKNEIFAILKMEHITIPKTGQIDVLKPFMERNGYYDGNGWWIPIGSKLKPIVETTEIIGGTNIMSRKLVAYFSASGVTAAVAQTLADAIGADIFEIAPKVPYTKADLNWMDKNARSTIEMNDPASRPEIASKRDNMDDYDTIFVGFPIWWYVAPVIINTFLESYDLTGKTIIPFATSGGSGMGKTNEKLAPSCKGAKLLEGRVLNPHASIKELTEWAESLQI